MRGMGNLDILRLSFLLGMQVNAKFMTEVNTSTGVEGEISDQYVVVRVTLCVAPSARRSQYVGNFPRENGSKKFMPAPCNLFLP